MRAWYWIFSTFGYGPPRVAAEPADPFLLIRLSGVKRCQAPYLARKCARSASATIEHAQCAGTSARHLAVTGRKLVKEFWRLGHRRSSIQQQHECYAASLSSVVFSATAVFSTAIGFMSLRLHFAVCVFANVCISFIPFDQYSVAHIYKQTNRLLTALTPLNKCS